jgi:hypothetical protein
VAHASPLADTGTVADSLVSASTARASALRSHWAGQVLWASVSTALLLFLVVLLSVLVAWLPGRARGSATAP